VHKLTLVLTSISKANFLHSKQSSRFLLLYFFSGLVIFGTCAFLGVKHQQAIYQAVLSYLFPSSWHRAADIIVDFLFSSQSKVVLAGLVSGGSLVMASLLLFPIKEKCSAAYEKSQGFPNGQGKELTLWMQATEESKLILLYVISQMIILAIGYYPYAYTRVIAEVLSILFLAFTFSIDFITPTLQRHGIKYNAVLRLLLKHFFFTVFWGAVFTLPALYIGKYLLSQNELTLIEVSAYIFVLNLFVLSFAIASGTYLASAILPQAKNIKPLTPRLRQYAYLVIGVLFSLGVIFHSSIFVSIHHKSQALKMEYSIGWSEVDVKMDSVMSLFKEQGEISINFPLQVLNPTIYDFELEDSFIILKQEDREIAYMAISHIRVPAGEYVTQHMHANIRISGKSLSGFRKLMSGWSAYLTYDVLPGIPLVFQIM